MRNILFCLSVLFVSNLYAQTPLTVRQVFDFNIGDEFHYSTSNYGNYTSLGGVRMYILDKTISANNDTVMYQIHMNRFGQNINQQNGQLIDTIYQTIIYESTYYNLDSSLRQLSYSNSPSSYLNYYSLYSSYNLKLSELEFYISQGQIDSSCLNNFNLYFSDTLINWQLDTFNHNSYFSSYSQNINTDCNLYNSLSYSQRFAEGLGSVGFSESVSGGPYYGSSHSMTYYRKGSTEIGTPINNLVPTEAFGNQGISVFPNPVKDVLNIFSTAALYGQEFTIYNSSGIVVLDGKLNADFQALSMADLASGFYFLKIHDSSSGIYKIIKL